MALTAGELQILIDVNTGEIDKLKQKLGQVDKASKKTQVGFGKLAGSFLTAQAGMALAQKGLQALTQGFKFAVNTARDLEEGQNKLRVTFRGIQGEAFKTRDALVKSYGFSTKEATNLLGATGDLLTGLGFQREEALRLSTQVQELSADLASFQNLEGGATRASEALTKALLGETESAKSLGIVIRQGTKEFNEQVKQLMESTGATEMQAKSQLILEQAITQSKNAIGDFGRTVDSLANRQRRLAAVQEDVAGSIGGIFTPVINLVTGQLLEAAEKMKEFFKAGENVTKFQAAIKAISIVFFTLYKAVNLNFLILKSFGKIILTVANAFIELLSPAIIFVADTVTKFANAIKEKLEPVLNAIGKAIEFVSGKAKDLGDKFKIDIGSNLPDSKILNLKGAFDKLGDGFKDVGNDFGDFVGETASGIDEILNLYKEAEKEAEGISLVPGGGDKKATGDKKEKISVSLDTQGFTESTNAVANAAGELQGNLFSGFNDVFSKIGEDAEKTGQIIATAFIAGLEAIKGALTIVEEVINTSFENRLETLNMQHDSEIDAIDERLARELELLENNGMTKEEALQKEIAALRAAGNEEEAIEKDKELKSLQLKARANKMREEADKKLAKKQYQIQVEQFRANQALQAVNASISFAQGLISMWASVWQVGPIAGPILGGVFTGLLTGIFAAQLATILSQSPPPPPRFQQGGMVSAIVGERGAEIAQFPTGTAITDAQQTRNVLNQPTVIENRLFIGEDEMANVITRASINNRRAESNR